MACLAPPEVILQVEKPKILTTMCNLIMQQFHQIVDMGFILPYAMSNQGHQESQILDTSESLAK